MNTFVSIFYDSVRPLKLITVPLYTAAAVGMVMSDIPESSDLHLIFHTAPWWSWALLSLYIVVARLIGLFWWHGSVYSRRITPVVGIVQWSMFFAASAVAPNFSMGVLYLVAALVEVWLLARAITDNPTSI